jgi:hypothetical protein
LENPPAVLLKELYRREPADATMKEGDKTQENVGEEEDTQKLVSDTVAATPDGSDDSNATVHPPASTTVIDIHSIEDFEVRQLPPVTQCLALLYEATDDGHRPTPIPPTRIRQLKI